MSQPDYENVPLPLFDDEQDAQDDQETGEE